MAYDDSWDSYPPAKILPTTLSVENFGPIAEAEVELRPLTVFVGPSDTGKSYLSALIYALHNLFSSLSSYTDSFSHRMLHPQLILDIDPIAPDLVEQVLKVAGEWWLADEQKHDYPEAYGVFPTWLPEEIVEVVDSVLVQNALLAKVTFSEIGRCFGIREEISKIIRYASTDNTSVRLLAEPKQGAPKALQFEASIAPKWSFVASQTDDVITASIPKSALIEVTDETYYNVIGIIDGASKADARGGDEATKDTNTATEIISDLLPTALQQIGGPLGSQAYYLPADRGGLMHVHHEVMRTLISTGNSSLPGLLRDFLQYLLAIPADREDSSSGKGNILAEQIEKEVLRGTTRVEKSDLGYPSFHHKPEGWTDDLPLVRTSSKISELTPLALYLRYHARLGETLIIDEPESHLHPEAQVAMATFLARLVNAGYRVIIATHSDWILEQLANLVQMSNLTPEERKDLDGADAALTPEQFGAWLFRHDTAAGGTMVEEIDIDPEAGGLVRDYRQILDETYNTWAEIGNRIADREE